jgi:fructokinase
MELEPGNGRDGRACLDGRRKHLGTAVDRDDRPAPAPPRGPLEQVHRDVHAAGPDVEECQLAAVGGDGVDRGLAQARATEPPVDPAEVTQVAEQRRQVVQRPVEQLDPIGHAIHPGETTPADYDGRVIVVAGEALIDLLVQPNGSVAAVPGGGPYNTARTIARLGGEVAYLGRLSTDRFGQRLRAELAADGVDLRFVESTDDATTMAIAELDDHGVATYRFLTEGTSAPGLSEAAAEAAFAAPFSALHVGTLGLVLEPLADVLLDAWTSNGTEIRMIDLNIRPAAIHHAKAFRGRMDRILAAGHVFKASVEDLAFLYPDTDPIRAAEYVKECADATVLVTNGAASVYIVGPDPSTGEAGRRFVRPFADRPQVIEVPVPAVPVTDTVGAGDAFGGAFLAWWIEHGLGHHDLSEPGALVEAVTRAIEVASLTVQRPGADPPRRSEVGWPPL